MMVSDIFNLGVPGPGGDDGHGNGGRGSDRGHQGDLRSFRSLIRIRILGGLHLPFTGDGSLAGADCSIFSQQPEQSSPSAPTTNFGAPAGVSVADPSTVSIPSIGACSDLIPLGTHHDGSMQVPSVHTPGQAGWYDHGVRPGEMGPAVVVGHCDGAGQLGVFHLLRDISIGDDVYIGRSDGSTLTFRVAEIEQMPKGSNVGTRRLNEAKLSKVFGDVDRPALRVITCGGRFVGGELGYADNIVVFADLI